MRNVFIFILIIMACFKPLSGSESAPAEKGSFVVLVNDVCVEAELFEKITRQMNAFARDNMGLYHLKRLATKPGWVVPRFYTKKFFNKMIIDCYGALIDPCARDIIKCSIKTSFPKNCLIDPLKKSCRPVVNPVPASPTVTLKDGSVVSRKRFQEILFYLGRQDKMYNTMAEVSSDNHNELMLALIGTKFPHLLHEDTSGEAKKIICAAFEYDNGCARIVDPTGRWYQLS